MSTDTAPRGRTRVRGSFKPRGDRKSNQPSEPQLEGELLELKKRYGSELGMLQELFPDWQAADLLLGLEQRNGDLELTIEGITSGTVTQFVEVPTAKDRSKSKVKESFAQSSASEKTASARGRGASQRASRGRPSERGGRASRGGRGGHAPTTTNGTTGPAAAETTPSTWDQSTTEATSNNGEESTGDSSKSMGDNSGNQWSNVANSENTPVSVPDMPKSSVIPDGQKKTWASMFAKPAPAPVPKKPAHLPTQQAPTAELVAQSDVPAATSEVPTDIKDQDPVPPIKTAEEVGTMEPAPVSQADIVQEQTPPVVAAQPDPLTEENVEHLPDESHPPATQTVASTTGSVDPRNLTPLPTHVPIGRPPTGGYAATAARAAGGSGRTASFQRRVQEQQEAVVMPGHNAVDRAAVQFGSMGLNGEPGPDVDEDREEPETRQAPQHSPPSQVRTSLPPGPRHTDAPQQPVVPEGMPTPKQAPGLPPASQQNQQQIQNAMSQGVSQDQAQMNQFGQYARYGQTGMQQDSFAQQQKSYDGFGQQPQQGHYDQFASQPQTTQPQASQAGFGGLSSAGYDYSQYQTADAQRNPYSQYYGGSYGHQDTRNQMAQDVGMSQQRSSSGFGGNPNESAFGSQTQQQVQQSRYGENAGSGHNTPNPIAAHQQQQQQSAPGQHSQQHSQQHSMHQQHQHHQQQQQGQGQQGGYAGAVPGFPYGHPYYNSPYQQAYNNQFGYQGGYNAGYPSKGSMYGGSGYGMGAQSSYDQHSSSPANAGAFGQSGSMRSASGMGGLGGSLEEYGRTSAQGQHQGSGFGGGMSDPFARSTSGFGGQQASYGQQQQQAALNNQEDPLKPFNDTKGGPSPALGQPGRPGSAANNTQAAQAGMPPTQSHQSGFGGGPGYGGFPGQGGGYGGLGGLGTHAQGQSGMGTQGGYGAAYGGGFGQYGAYGSRGGGGWGANYGAH